ncbi:parvulin-like peptidyl-prolyl isomerase [Rivularia sp. PCC 7116]|uniref:peptidylprolyl isomerase n=1 Tax=Rivularia sp. PCC 7116 TaxID=373994 RepID=UPI00029EFBF7|nr:peptidylprolyl isomerase [Rivularia sp. PCC 7116]AFY52967.1 parvulin-like peptidyl-prolyl isomerase [Rivularia sp. PCC 7116]
MKNILSISSQEIIHYLKISCQVPDVIEGIAIKKIIADIAKQADITVSEDELQQEGDRLRFAKKLVKATDTWAWLKRHHLALNEFEELAYNNIIWDKVAHHLFSDTVESFFYQNQFDFMAAATYEVVLDDYDLALELFYGIQENELTFPEIAREYISNPQSRRAAGYQGIKQRNDFRPEVAAAVFAAKPPQVIKPITINKSVYLIWVEEIIQPDLNDELREQIITDLFDDWLKQQIQQMEISTSLDSNSDNQASPDSLMQA